MASASAKASAVRVGNGSRLRDRLEEALPQILAAFFVAVLAVVGWTGLQVIEQGKTLARLEGKLDALKEAVDRLPRR